MAKKDVIVIGLGRFGCSVSMNLEKKGYNVLAVDSSPQKVHKIADYVTHAVCADVTNEETMEDLGVGNFDIAIIAIGQNMESSILATIWAKDQGVKRVIAKAYDETQGKILLKIGADEIVFPEKEMGKHLANNITLEHITDAIELTDDYSIAEVQVFDSWVGENLISLDLRGKYGINVIAVKRGNDIIMNLKADAPILNGDIFVVLGENKMIRKLLSKK